MATKDEIINGLQFLVQEAKRMRDQLSEEEWARAADMDGWKNKQVMAHLAGTAAIVAPFVTNLANAGPGADAAAGFDINALNAQVVAQRADKSIPELVSEVESGYSGVIDWVRSLPDDTLGRRATVAGYRDVPVSDLLMRMVVLHGVGHIYSAYSAVMGPIAKA